MDTRGPPAEAHADPAPARALTGGPELAAAAARLAAGGIVAFPTETVYGLGADALNAAAVARVFALKGRPAHNPLIVHVSGVPMARELAGAWPPAAEVLARAFWPGPLTLVVPRAACVPAIVAAGGDTVAVRCPDHPVAAALLMLVGRPLVGPSANRSGRISPTTAAHVRAAFDPADVAVVDGGACGTGIESTVVDLCARPYRVLRLGVISAAALAAALGEPVLDSDNSAPASGRPATPLRSPGQLASHYAPRTRAALVDSWALIDERVEDGERLVALALSVAADDEGWPARGCTLIRMPPEAAAYAARLYAALREADDAARASGATIIAVERPPAEGPDAEATAIWRAVADRLGRATA